MGFLFHSLFYQNFFPLRLCWIWRSLQSFPFDDLDKLIWKQRNMEFAKFEVKLRSNPKKDNSPHFKMWQPDKIYFPCLFNIWRRLKYKSRASYGVASIDRLNHKLVDRVKPKLERILKFKFRPRPHSFPWHNLSEQILKPPH